MSDDATLEFTYRVWPIGGNEQVDGTEERETKSVSELEVKEAEDGSQEVMGFIEPKDGYNKRLIKVVVQGSCSGEDNVIGSSNGGNVSSANWWVSLGRGPNGAGVGNLRVEEAEMGEESATPARLKYDGGVNSLVEILRDDAGFIRQVKVPQGLADVQVIDAFSYEIRFYDSVDVGEIDEETGFHEIDGIPFSIWKVENPDGIGNYSRLKISHTVGEGTELYVFENHGGGLWSLESGDDLQTEEKTRTVLPNGDIQVVRVTKDANGVASYKVREVSRLFPWGERLIEEVLDPDGAVLTTTWTYYDNQIADGGAYGQLKSAVHSDGGWARYEYDSSGRRSKTISSYLDAAAGASESASRVETTGFSGDGLTATIVETAVGQEVGRRYWVKSADGNQIQNIVCTSAGAGIGDSGNLTTTTTYVASGEFAGRIASVIRPDGTGTFHSYSHDGAEYTTVTKSGEVSGNTAVVGRQTTVVENEFGSLLSRETRDIASGLVIDSMTVTENDEFGRPERMDYADGTFETRSYSCCGIETETDRQGVTTSYTYDALKRIETETRNGLTTIYGYDGSGRVRTITRVGSDSSEIVTETNDYDLTGRLTSSKNALNETTGYSEEIGVSGRMVRTTTYPDLSTRVETIHRDGQLYSVGGTAAPPLKYEYGVDSDGPYRKEIRVRDGGGETEWTKTVSDLAGRMKRIELANGGVTAFSYNALGQLVKEVDPDGVTKLYAYNGEGERIRTAVDLNGDDAIGNGDQITINESGVVSAHGAVVERRETRVVAESGAEVVASRVDTTPNGRQSWSEQWGLPTTRVVSIGGSGGKTETISHPDGAETVRTYQDERLTGEATTAGGTAVRSVTYSYDPHGRLEVATDARNGATTYTYDAADRVTSITTPAAQGGAQTTVYGYDEMGRQDSETLPDASQISRQYYPTGELESVSGSQTYAANYTYDSQGRIKTMTTSGQAGAGMTTWTYYPDSGLPASKTYADGKGIGYAYTDAGRLETRAWQRGVTTTYGYDAGGRLETVDYSDGTPDVSYSVNRLGQITGITDGSGSRTLAYAPDGRLLSETYTAGILSGGAVGNGYDALLRRDSNTLQTGSGNVQIGFGYDGASRLQTVTAGSDTAVYTYWPNSSLIHTVTQANGGNSVLTTTKSYDALNRLTSISASMGGSEVSSHTYTYNALNQRTNADLQDGTRWNYGYDSLGQVTSAGRKWNDNSDVSGQQFGYTFDGIGNRTSTTVNGRSASYTANVVNQYIQRQVPPALDIIGSAATGTTVTVNEYPVQRKDEYFHGELPVGNQSGPQYPEVTALAVKNNAGPSGEDLVDAITGRHYLPRNPEAFFYDDDGNLVGDGRWQYTWDGENRLVAMESIAAAPDAAKKKLTFAYDAQGRRVRKTVFAWDGAAYVPSEERRFLYDGWNLIAELDGSNAVLRSYAWGADLSGSFEGAGGIGGLLVIQGGGSFYPAYDGNGNVMAVVNAGTQQVAARYQYGPFGEPIQTFESGFENPFQFSTKYHDAESGFAYYGYRYYSPAIGRWLSRDPIEEAGGLNLYVFVANDALSKWDPLGLEWHHLLSQGIFTPEFLRKEEITDLDINDKKYGWDLDFTVHRGKGNSVHSSGWNKDWREWIRSEKAAGRKITKCSIEKQLEVMKRNYSNLLSKGTAVSSNYRKVNYRFIKGVGGMSTLLLFTLAAGEFTGANAAIAEELQSDMEEYLSAGEESMRMIKAASIADKAGALFGVPDIIVLGAFVDKEGGF